MPGRHRLKAGAVRLLGRHDGEDGRAFRACYDALVAELGSFDRPLLRLEASRVAVAWTHLVTATRALAAARRAREQGKGRRPSAREIERLSRRQGLADATYSQALDKLLVKQDGRGQGDPLAAVRAAVEREKARAEAERAARPAPADSPVSPHTQVAPPDEIAAPRGAEGPGGAA